MSIYKGSTLVAGIYVGSGGGGGESSIKTLVVNNLPTVGNPSTVYLLRSSNPTSTNKYSEWIYINSAWEEWGVNPTYATNQEIDNIFSI